MSVNNDATMGAESMARELTDFLYNEGKKNKGLRGTLTLKECVKKLQEIESQCWENYNDWAEELGWK